MPSLLTDKLEIPPPPVPPRKRWTREECAQLAPFGLFETERLELVDGELISKMGKKRPHANTFRLMLVWLQETFGNRFVDPEVSIDVAPHENALNEPEPDLIVLNRPCDSFTSANPQPDDISLLVEIADTSLNFDRTVKAALYARARISEYWIVDVAGRRLLCHREPEGGRYASVVVYNEHESIAPLAAPEKQFSPAQVFPAS
jgi:Uma2 family endonuclease